MIVISKISEQKKHIYCECNISDIKFNDIVVLSYNNFEYLATVVQADVENKNNEIEATVIRKATNKDIKINLENIKDCRFAYKKCKNLIKKYNLDMKLLSASYSLDKKQLLFKYVADERIDFRNLAKDLASIYKTRIELRQIGIRDKASLVSGIGMCGRELCCATFLKEMDTVSINAAKTQHLALNPSKINGCCGRLLCCLNYEEEQYKESEKKLPEINSLVSTPNGEGKVVALKVLEEKYDVELKNGEIIEMGLEDNGSNS